MDILALITIVINGSRSRWRSDFGLFDPQTQQPLDLLRLLKGCPQLSLDVLLGAKELLPVRLVALRLPAPLAAQRRRRARANARRDRALRLSERYLKLLDWTILLTNVTPEQLNAQQLLETYACRWQIETLFKSWKSHFQLGRLPASGPRQVQIQLLAKLLAIALVQNSFAPRLHVPVRRPHVILFQKDYRHPCVDLSYKIIRIASDDRAGPQPMGSCP